MAEHSLSNAGIMTTSKHILPVAVQPIVHGSAGLTLSSEVRASLSRFREGHLSIHWLPAIVSERSPYTSGASDFCSLIFFVGAPLSFAAAAFFGSFFKEAGSDVYRSLKEFIVRTVATQTTTTYRANVRIMIIFELEDDFCSIELEFLDSSIDTHRARGDQRYFEEVEKIVELQIGEDVANLRDQWKRIQSVIDKFHIGKEGDIRRSQRKIHVIRRSEKGWTIEPVDSDEYFRSRFPRKNHR